jgi:anti-sigma regulatory factor (Ser/Thr protein kinase)
MPPGAILVFYTDGLTDRRTRADGSGHYSETEATEMLRHAVRAAAASGDADTVATAAEFAVPGDIDDDMAILVVKSSPSELASTGHVFPAEPIMVSEARRLAAQTFTSWGMDAEQVELACLLVSEVVTNAVLHASITPSPNRNLDLELEPLIMPAPVNSPAGPPPVAPVAPVPPLAPMPARSAGRASAAAAVQKTRPAAQRAATERAAEPVPASTGLAWDGALDGGLASAQPPAREFALRLRRGATSVWVEVFDPDLRLPRIRTAGETDEGGRGLYLVEQLATRWGSRPTPEGKAVWFEMPRSGKGT